MWGWLGVPGGLWTRLGEGSTPSSSTPNYEEPYVSAVGRSRARVHYATTPNTLQGLEFLASGGGVSSVQQHGVHRQKLDVNLQINGYITNADPLG